MDQNGSSDKGKDVARPRSWREQDDLPHMHGAGQNVASADPAVPGSQAPDSLPAVPVESGTMNGQNSKPRTLPTLQPLSIPSAPLAPIQPAIAQPESAQYASVQSTQHAAPPNGRPTASGSGQCSAGSGSLPRVNKPKPDYSEEETVRVSYLVFLARPSADGNEPEFQKFEVDAPITSRASRGAPPVDFRAKIDLVRKDQSKFFDFLDEYNTAFMGRRERICFHCKKPVKTFVTHTKALYKFHKFGGQTDTGRDGVFRPMCQIIPVCDGTCYESLKTKSRVEELRNNFLDTFGNFSEFHHNNPERDFVIFEYPKQGLNQVLTWCGVCRERWYADDGIFETALSTQFRKHCSKSGNCQKLSKERAHWGAGSGAASGASAQNLDATNSSADQRNNGIAGSSTMQNGGYASQQPGQTGHQQQLASPTRQENNLQDQSAIASPVRPDSNGSDSTLQGGAISLGGSHPFGEVKSGHEGESRRGFMGTLKGTFSRKAGRSVNNQNDRDEDRPEATFWRRMICRSGNTS